MTTAGRTNARSDRYDPASNVPEGMVWIEGGTFLTGSNQRDREERPADEVRVNGFWIDCTCVTNEQFARFVRETGYVTLAERLANAARGGDWLHPLGPDSSIEQLQDHPVVHVAFEDAMAYASWTGKRLPTEVEWELAAYGGRNGAQFVGGRELLPNGKVRANIWLGELPYQNLLEDSRERISPAGAVAAQGHGLFDGAGDSMARNFIAGNFTVGNFRVGNFRVGEVWQWTTDWYVEPGSGEGACGLRVPRKAIKGGSFSGAANDGRAAERRGHPIDTSSCHVGFRCVIRYDGPLP